MKVEEEETEKEQEEEGEETDEAGKTTETGQQNGSSAENPDMMDVDVDARSVAKSQVRFERRNRGRPRPEWNLQVPLGTEEETERWTTGDMADIYENALRTLQRLQGEGDDGGDYEPVTEGNALATTVGKAERAARAAEVVEKM